MKKGNGQGLNFLDDQLLLFLICVGALALFHQQIFQWLGQNVGEQLLTWGVLTKNNVLVGYGEVGIDYLRLVAYAGWLITGVGVCLKFAQGRIRAKAEN